MPIPFKPRDSVRDARERVATATSSSGPFSSAVLDEYDAAGVQPPQEALYKAAQLDRRAFRQQRDRVGLPNLSLGLASKAMALAHVGKQERLQAQLDDITRPVRNEEARLQRIRARASTNSSVISAQKAALSLELEQRTFEDRVATVKAGREAAQEQVRTQAAQTRTQNERTRGAKATADRGEFALTQDQLNAPFATRAKKAAAQQAETALADSQNALDSNKQLRADKIAVSAIGLQKAEYIRDYEQRVRDFRDAYASSDMTAKEMVEMAQTAPSPEEREAALGLAESSLGIRRDVADTSAASAKANKATSDAKSARFKARAAELAEKKTSLAPLLAQNLDAARAIARGERVAGYDTSDPAIYAAANDVVQIADDLAARQTDLASKELSLAEGTLDYTDKVQADIVQDFVQADYLTGGQELAAMSDKGYALQVGGKTQHIPKAAFELASKEFAVQLGEQTAALEERAAKNLVVEARLDEVQSRTSLLVDYAGAPIPQAALAKLAAAREAAVTGEDPEQSVKLLDEAMLAAGASVATPTVAQQAALRQVAFGRFTDDAPIIASLQQYHTLPEEAVADHFSSRPLAGATMDGLTRQAHDQRSWAEYLSRGYAREREDPEERAARTYVNAYGVDEDGQEDPTKVKAVNRAIRDSTRPIIVNAVASTLAGRLTDVIRDNGDPKFDQRIQAFVIQPLAAAETQKQIEASFKNLAIIEQDFGVDLYNPLKAAIQDSAFASGEIIKQQMSGPSLGTMLPLAKAWGVDASVDLRDLPYNIGFKVTNDLLSDQLHSYSSVHKTDAKRKVYEGAVVLNGFDQAFEGTDAERDTAISNMAIDDSAIMYALDANLMEATGQGPLIEGPTSIGEDTIPTALRDGKRASASLGFNAGEAALSARQRQELDSAVLP